MPGPQAFVEINPYHAETLFFYHADCSIGGEDIVFGHRRLFGQPLFDDIPARHVVYSFLTFLRGLGRRRFRTCHFNTINPTLYPVTRETVTLALQMVLLPIVARLAGCATTCIVHEAEQFFDLGAASSGRERAFRRVVGWWLIQLFRERYVLAPEVQAFLHSRGVKVTLLDPRPLTRFDTTKSASLGRIPTGHVLCWVGPIVGHRRAYRMLLDLDSVRLDALNVSIVMLCDSRLGDGPALRQAVEANGLGRHFTFFDRRPDDRELFAWAQRSCGILCLYASPSYGRTKSSGARTIALAFDKPFIANRPALGVYDSQGVLLRAGRSLTDCVADANVQEIYRLRRTQSWLHRRSQLATRRPRPG
jgi:hypothetical protein